MKGPVVITGGAGFIGANLTRRLVFEKTDVHIITKPGGSSLRLSGILSHVRIHPIGLSERKILKQLLYRIKPRYVFHIAAYGSYPHQDDSDEMVRTNIVGTLNLLECLRIVPYKNLILVGSSSEYGTKNTPMKESDVLVPNNLYAATKASQTHLAQAFAATYDIPITILRLFNVYGPFEEKGRLVRSVIESVLSRKPIQLATGKEVRDFVHTDDVVDAMIHAATANFRGEVFNIGTGVETTIYELARMVVKLTGISIPIRRHAYPGRAWDTYHWKADMEKTNSMLRWKPKVSLRDGLTRTMQWYKEESAKRK